MTRDEILAIPITAPGRLFHGSNIKERYWELAQQWHPDKKGDAEVFSHIGKLRDAALASIIEIKSKEGRKYRLAFLRRHLFELGEMFVCRRYVVFKIDNQYDDFILRGLKRLGSIHYPTAEFRKSLEMFFPKVEKIIVTKTDHWILIPKTDDVVLLKDLLDHAGKLPATAVAWIVSSLMNLACFLEITGICHNGITIETVFVTPPHHAVYLLGGWWYATEQGSPLRFLCPQIHAIAPRDVVRTKKSDIRVDLESIRAVARLCLGDCPKPMGDYLTLPAPKSAMDDYGHWPEVLKESFGPRKFVKLPITAVDIYVA